MKPKVFLDSSVIIAGLISQSGGSAKILQLIEDKKIIGTTCKLVLSEVEKNLSKKLPKLLPLFYRLLLNSFFSLVEDSSLDKNDQELLLTITKISDAVIVKTCQKHHLLLLTLDKKHLLADEVRKLTGLNIETPGSYLQRYKR